MFKRGDASRDIIRVSEIVLARTYWVEGEIFIATDYLGQGAVVNLGKTEGRLEALSKEQGKSK